MKIMIPIKPLSINKAHHGRHIKTKEFLRYEKNVSFMLPFNPKELEGGEYFIKYSFYIKNYEKSDTGNFEKLITDILVKRGYLRDDRFIKAMYLEKIKVMDIKDEKIVLEILRYQDHSPTLSLDTEKSRKVVKNILSK